MTINASSNGAKQQQQQQKQPLFFQARQMMETLMARLESWLENGTRVAPSLGYLIRERQTMSFLQMMIRGSTILEEGTKWVCALSKRSEEEDTVYPNKRESRSRINCTHCQTWFHLLLSTLSHSSPAHGPFDLIHQLSRMQAKSKSNPISHSHSLLCLL